MTGEAAEPDVPLSNGPALTAALTTALSNAPLLSELTQGIRKLDARLGSTESRIDDHSKQLQLHHEMQRHTSGASINALSDGAVEPPSALYALQQRYPPRSGPSMGRGGYSQPSEGPTRKVHPREYAGLSMKDRPWPFMHPITDMDDLLPHERKKMMEATGITGPTDEKWTTMNVYDLPGQRCGCCHSTDHTNGWCPALWRQTKTVVAEKGEAYSEAARRRLVWYAPRPAQMATLAGAMRQHDDVDGRVEAIVNDESLADLLEEGTLLARACADAQHDEGHSLFVLISAWADPQGSA